VHLSKTEESAMIASSPAVAARPVGDLADVTAVRMDGGDPELAGSACQECGAQAFPRRVHCQECFSMNLVDVGLGAVGRLYSFTVVRVSSSRPTPYAIGYVDLPGGLRVLADIAEGRDPHQEFRCDVAVRLEADEEGWRFRVDEASPARAASAQGLDLEGTAHV
jgi:uncharacterized protein